MANTQLFSNIKVHRWLLAGGFFALVGTVLLFSNRFFWDEPYYYHNLDLFIQYGWGYNFLRNEWGSAGPLYTIVHYLFLPITLAKLPNIRFINLGLLLIVMGLGAMILKKFFKNNPWNSLVFLAIPMTYVCSGIALTEMPSFLFLYLSLLVLFWVLYQDYSLGGKIIFAAIAGLLFGIAIMGRQPLMVTLVALPALLLEKGKRTRENAFLLAIFIVFSLPLPLYVFSVWEGLLAPKEQITTSGWSIFHFWMGLGYLSLITFIIAPRFFVAIPRKYFGWAFLTIFTAISLNVATQGMFYMPMSTLSSNFLPNWMGFVFAALLIVLGTYYILSAIYRTMEQSNDALFVFVTLATLFVAFTSIKITHQYSSRYAFQAAPFIILQLSRYQVADGFQLVRFSSGILIGLTSLYLYIG